MASRDEAAAFMAREFPQARIVIDAVGEVSLYSEGQDEPVAHVVGTYSIPPRRAT